MDLRKIQIVDKKGVPQWSSFVPGIVQILFNVKGTDINFVADIDLKEKPFPSSFVILERAGGEKLIKSIESHYLKELNFTEKDSDKKLYQIRQIMISDLNYDFSQVKSIFKI